MRLRGSFQKTKNLFHATLQRLRSIFFAEYQKLPKPIPCNPFSCGRENMKHRLADRCCTEFCNEWECDLEKARKRKNNTLMVSMETNATEGASNGCIIEFAKSPLKEKEVKEEKKKRYSHVKRQEEKCANNIKEEGYALANKMKELEMMDVCDVEHVLDVEEALHYYSRLKSPVYLDIVDKFFTDMYTEFSTPQPTVSITNSKRRLGSSRRFR
ncbi:hypothetical protein K2173_004282 [Erythroxylum novogranatense]|uniref:OVATE domain-containing protein n=1 Tax=Erythroxylum novogranatense TaxID=1862640 RepID=A0AAV8U2D5_9ROSI|nr:hypothetical protein K2173_004282 [Erythroxylum novogranatense]